jgi:hypothetical protein
MGPEERFPRELSPIERELLLWVLPEDRPGYAAVRTLAEQWKVVGEGRRGEGDFILAAPDTAPDLESPLPPLLAVGSATCENSEITISVRELAGDQLEFEITPQLAGLPRELRLHRRWTLSEWLPSHDCPSCGGMLREVRMETVSAHLLVLALCARDHRLWVYDGKSGINHPIPVTSYYNELMLKKKVHDAATVLHSNRLFTDLPLHSDADLTAAFSSYNRMRRRVVLGEPLMVPTESSKGWFDRATRRLFKRG